MGPVTIEESDDEMSIVTPGLRLRFRLEEGRWAHFLDGRADTGWRPIAASVEADPARDGRERLVSATYQEAVIQRQGGEVVALLVGHQARHHFSAEFRVASDPAPGGVPGVTVGVDVADRCPSGVEVLSATYAIHRPIQAVGPRDDFGAACVLEDGAEFSFGVIDRIGAADRFAVADVDPARFCVQFRADPRARPETHRLYYAFQINWCP